MYTNLKDVDLTQKLEKKEYKASIKELQKTARKLSHFLAKKKRSVVIVFEGWDAGGKGGTIRRLTSLVDPRLYVVHSIAAPNDVEKKHHYLWRFWNLLPKSGVIGIFDRSWYGRVLVERVEGFCQKEEWERAYNEILHFEMDLLDSRAIVLKFWLHISQEEQLSRFNSRKEDPLKRWKLTEEDWRNREKWNFYEDAANQMFEKTNHPLAPWYIIPSNNKHYARVMVLKIFCERLSREMKISNKNLG